MKAARSRQLAKITAFPLDNELFRGQLMQKLALNDGIAAFYDDSSGLWESMWGDHMHHGYYPEGAAPKSNQQAQIDMIEEVVRWAGVSDIRQACLFALHAAASRQPQRLSIYS